MAISIDPDKGIQLPNKTTAQIEAIVSPLTGSSIYNTDIGAKVTFNGTTWERDGSGSSSLGSRNTVVNQEAVSQGTSTRTGFSATKYTGNGSTQSISTGVDMATGDFGGLVWAKGRGTATFNNHILSDSIRGATKFLQTNATASEGTDAGALTSFDSTGFSIGSLADINTNLNTYIAWSWQTNQKATGVTNRNKPYTCHYNTDLGFSIVGYEGDGVDGHEIPHFLGREPELSIFKNRDAVTNWLVKSNLFGLDDYLELNGTGALGTDAATSTIFSDITSKIDLSAYYNTSSNNYISYHFTSIPNVSKVGKYIGTGAAGNYVECGFKPAWVMVKNLTTGTTDWVIHDSARGNTIGLYPNTSGADTTGWSFDFVEDGFIANSTGSLENGLNDEYIFLAFAETSTDATKAWTDYEYATSQDTLTINQNTLLSFANGFSASGQVDTQENVPAGTTYTLGATHENKHYWLYKDKAGNYGVSEYRPLEGTSRNTADKWGVQSPLDASLRTTAKHFDYESETGVALASSEFSGFPAYQAFNKQDNPYTTKAWASNSTTTGWLQYKFNEKRILKSWRLMATNTASELPTDFTIEGSNDGLNWTVIDNTYVAGTYAGNGVGLWGDLQDTSANTTAYLYHRINVTANNGGTLIGITNLEFNTILPSDYYLIDEGVMYNSSNTPIERVYLAELWTNSNGDISHYVNLPVAKQRFTEAEVQGDLKVHGEIENRGVCTAWVKVDQSENPPLIYDAYNVSDVVDEGVGYCTVYFKEPMDNKSYAVTASGRRSTAKVTSLVVNSVNHSVNSVRIESWNTSNVASDADSIEIAVFGGKEIK